MEYIRKNGNAQVEIKSDHFSVMLDIFAPHMSKQKITMHTEYNAQDFGEEYKGWLCEIADELLDLHKAVCKYHDEYAEKYYWRP